MVQIRAERARSRSQSSRPDGVEERQGPLHAGASSRWPQQTRNKIVTAFNQLRSGKTIPSREWVGIEWTVLTLPFARKDMRQSCHAMDKVDRCQGLSATPSSPAWTLAVVCMTVSAMGTQFLRHPTRLSNWAKSGPDWSLHHDPAPAKARASHLRRHMHSPAASSTSSSLSTWASNTLLCLPTLQQRLTPCFTFWPRRRHWQTGHCGIVLSPVAHVTTAAAMAKLILDSCRAFRDHIPVCTVFVELFPIRKRGSSALPHERRGVWLPGRRHALHRLWAQGVRQDHFRGWWHDAHQRSEPQFLRLLENHEREH